LPCRREAVANEFCRFGETGERDVETAARRAT
jgi:hypothetical protein